LKTGHQLIGSCAENTHSETRLNNKPQRQAAPVQAAAAWRPDEKRRKTPFHLLHFSVPDAPITLMQNRQNG